MANRFKLRLSQVIPSFHSCRSKDPSTLPEVPVPAFFRLNIDFPVRDHPPLSKPNTSALKRQVSSAIVSVGCGCRSRSGRHRVISDDDTRSPEFKWKKEEKWHVVAMAQDDAPRRKIYNSSVSGDFSLSREKKKKKKKNAQINTSPADSGWFSNDEKETETLISSCRSFSTDSSSDYNPQLETIPEAPINMNSFRQKKKNLKKVKMVKRYAAAATKTKTCTTTSMETNSPARLSVFRRLIPCKVDGKVSESFVVVKKSEDPYGDFKRSMLEMILEKQMFEPKDLEQLLQCFISLNSSHHHGVIFEAFSEIWEALFCKSQMNQRVSGSS